MINPDRCINCASCAMACPYGVIRFHEDPFAPPGRAVAVKCDNCDARLARGMEPACVEACKTGALTFEDMGQAMKRRSDVVARALTGDMDAAGLPDGLALSRSMRRARHELGHRENTGEVPPR
jgi:carbon-monoxide dehydrogenase iron sulfur subunit